MKTVLNCSDIQDKVICYRIKDVLVCNLCFLGHTANEDAFASTDSSKGGKGTMILRLLLGVIYRVYIRFRQWRFPIAFPYYEVRRNRKDPFPTNLLYPRKEWRFDSPADGAISVIGDERRDRVLFHCCDTEHGEQLLISYERIARRLAQVWILLHFNGRTFTFNNPISLDQSSGTTYSSDGIRLSCDAPMRRWRIAFNGVMLETCTGCKVHVKFGIRFAAGSHPFEWPKHLRPESLSAFCQQLPMRRALNQIDRLYGRFDSFDQTGAFYADISVDTVRVRKPLFGGRVKEVGTGALDGLLLLGAGGDDKAAQVRHVIGYADNGTVLHCVTPYAPEAKTAMSKDVIGCVFSPSHYMKPMRNGTIERTNDTITTLLLQAAHVSYKLHVERKGHVVKFQGRSTYTVDMLTGTARIDGSNFKVNLFEITVSRSGLRPAVPLHLLALAPLSVGLLQPQSPVLVVSIADDIARQPNLTGEKGSSLAVLLALSKQYSNSKNPDRSTKFAVPRAVVLTVDAYLVFEKQRQVSSAIAQLQKAAGSGDQTEILRKACTQCESTLKATSLPVQVGRDLVAALVSTFGTGWHSRRFAVRSSAVAEDTEEISAAGQLTTFLGIQGLDHIEKSVVNCWASQFAFRAIQYKRQYGVSMYSRIAVVVQEMVNAEAVGVMFTCEPVSSNPLYSAISANLGLSASVVSAAAESDTFLVNKMNEDAYVVSEKTVGSKSTIIEQAPFSGTVTRPATAEEASRASVEDSVVIRLAKVGAIIDRSYGAARDIEWAIKNDEIYLLHCRPVTSVFRESDYEIEHDDNVALRTQRELLSRTNLDDVLPGCISSLTLSLFRFLFDNMTKYFSHRLRPGVEYERSPFTYIGAFCLGKRWYMNFSEPGFSNDSNNRDSVTLGMFGHDISKEEALLKSITYQRPLGSYTKLAIVFYLLKGIGEVEGLLRAARTIKTFSLEVTDEMSLKQIIDTIIYGVNQLDKGGRFLMGSSIPSMMLNVIVMWIIAKINGTKNLSAPETTSLFSSLIKSNFDIESANIPASMAKLARAIRTSSKGSEFATMTDDKALEWLQQSDETAACSYRDFIKRHGHRCYKEFDLISDPWELEPLELIRSLKASMTSGGQVHSEEVETTLDDLPKKSSLGQRLLLKWALPRARHAVYAREATKSALIYAIHKVRLAVRVLGRRMEQEGRLPSARLVHFLSFDELHRLVHSQSRNAALITKALRRSRLHPKLDKLSYQVLQCGTPKPLVAKTLTLCESSEKSELRGTPVSEGVIRGPARVVLDFEAEAHLIRRGEILVATATDTGWTPYFLLLSAVVTEIAGFLSHGAVVAREFGLPAVAGIRGVTRLVSQGDIILVDGGLGVVTILQKQQKSTEGI
ncbi:putative phosphotransferase yvkC-like [Tropilaelaps mercedesae]|uniref:Putative phosphotransferase yvkC-like n=1 Tax=Tropilaelaps mercedesae TaxID=418985 RepID=A0A1V9XJ14_9ACAR|nr:putative phosphotransferase yvkC-like [Tropilaelaps mercedesae]